MHGYPSIFNKLFRFYFDGFKNMPVWGKKVWIILIIKLFIMFALLRLFFFQDPLYKRFHSDSQRGEYVMDQLLNPR